MCKARSITYEIQSTMFEKLLQQGMPGCGVLWSRATVSQTHRRPLSPKISLITVIKDICDTTSDT